MQPSLAVFIATTDQRYPLDDGTEVTVGRTRECEIFLDDVAVSRRHCRFEAQGTEVLVTDLGSANGTHVNDRPVHSARARPGDTVRVGSTLMVIEDVSDRASAVGRDLNAVLSDDDTGIASVIRRRFEPAQFDFL